MSGVRGNIAGRSFRIARSKASLKNIPGRGCIPADVTDGALGLGDVGDHLGVRADDFRHRAFAREHQAAVVRLQRGIGFVQILLQKCFVSRPTLFDDCLDVPATGKRVLFILENIRALERMPKA